ncbi:unnamed protein product [Cuscuta europaea]|uniref:DUF7780 domain-containing protein n=1 Tax=Cuscuta europaea TaxID=41803 RepID=A0A9P0ZGY4_CUSEU|nr:unnamed protein product [Cuscuta europaea]
MGLPATWAAKENNKAGGGTSGTGGRVSSGSMSFLFLFFAENETAASKKQRTTHHMALDLFSNPSAFKPINALLRRSISTALCSTISIAALLLFFLTLLFFTIYFDPAADSAHFSARRLQNPASNYLSIRHAALQGMGTLYRRGSRAMSNLVVAHAVESLTAHDLRLFLRLVFRSGIYAKSDILLIFRSKSAAYDRVVAEENGRFLKLLHAGNRHNSTDAFDVAHFKISDKKMKESSAPIWGRKIRRFPSGGNSTESTRLSYGSVVGFDADELDPENSLAGFLDHVPMSSRRWACYPMLLGRVRRNFKHVTLVDAKEFLLLGDPLGRVKNKNPDSVYLRAVTQSQAAKRLKNLDKKWVTPGIISGGARGIRLFSSTMLTGIVGAAIQHKKKRPVTELGVINNLVQNELVLEKVNLVISGESIPGLSSLTELNRRPGFSGLPLVSTTITGNNNGDNSLVILKHLCSLLFLDATVYPDC